MIGQARATVATTTRDLPAGAGLGPPAEPDLARRAAAGCLQSRNDLVRKHLPYVTRVAGEFGGLGLPHEDLVHEGTLGLLDAVRRFDADRGFKFLTFATWWIRKSMRVALRNGVGVVAVPSHQRRRLREIRDAEFELRAELGRRPDETELSERVGRSVSLVRRTIGRGRYEARIDTPAGEDGSATWAQLLEDPDAIDPEADLLRGELRERLRRELDGLGRREFDILRWRFGLDGEPVRSLQEVSERIGVSRERVRQIEVDVKRRLRRRLSRCRLAPVG